MSSNKIEQYNELLTQTISQLNNSIYNIKDYTLNSCYRTADFQALKIRLDYHPTKTKRRPTIQSHYGTIKNTR